MGHHLQLLGDLALGCEPEHVEGIRLTRVYITRSHTQRAATIDETRTPGQNHGGLHLGAPRDPNSDGHRKPQDPSPTPEAVTQELQN
jgi:hypothetical protein